jgi:hypothetical protein
MTLNKNVLKNIGGEITKGILLNGDAQKIRVITGGEITCPRWKRFVDEDFVPLVCWFDGLDALFTWFCLIVSR